MCVMPCHLEQQIYTSLVPLCSENTNTPRPGAFDHSGQIRHMLLRLRIRTTKHGLLENFPPDKWISLAQCLQISQPMLITQMHQFSYKSRDRGDMWLGHCTHAVDVTLDNRSFEASLNYLPANAMRFEMRSSSSDAETVRKKNRDARDALNHHSTICSEKLTQ